MSTRGRAAGPDFLLAKITYTCKYRRALKAAVSLRDIARRARVSHVTVSNVLNRVGREKEVSSRTALLIRRLAREMNYVPNQAARTLKLGKTQTIALATRNSLRYAYSHELVEGLQAQLSTYG